MKPAPECGTCLFHWVYERTAPYLPPGERARLAEQVAQALFREIAPDANLGRLCNVALAATGELRAVAQEFYDPFQERSNRRAEELLPGARDYVAAGGSERERFERACAVAAAANVAPLGKPSDVFSFPEVAELLEGSRRVACLGDPHGAARSARRVLYVADNAGEIGFDRLVLELFGGMAAHVTLVVKEEPLFEDARRSDAGFFRLESLADEIVTSSGFLDRSRAEPALAEAYDRADLLVCKGTGAFEALYREAPAKTAVFLLKVKCRPIARETGAPEGEVVVLVEPPAE